MIYEIPYNFLRHHSLEEVARWLEETEIAYGWHETFEESIRKNGLDSEETRLLMEWESMGSLKEDYQYLLDGDHPYITTWPKEAFHEKINPLRLLCDEDKFVLFKLRWG